MAENNNEIVDKPNYIAKGKSGTLVTGYTIQDEYLSELLGVSGQEVYERMSRSDSQVRKIMHSINNPIKSATWDIEPASEETKDLEVAALIKQILFKDLPDGFVGKLDEILDFPWFGHSIFEVIHKNYDKKPFGPYTGLANLAWRDQRTITEWRFSHEGVLLSLKQSQSGEIPVEAEIPAENLLIFYNEKKGNNAGFPFLRMIYGNYKRKNLYKQLQAIGIERAAIPVPHIEMPPDTKYDSDEAKNAESQLAAFTQAQTAYFMTPHGWKLNYNQVNTFDPSKVQVAIKSENEEMVGSIVAMFLEMGIGGNSGNQAGTSVSADFFRAGLEYIANKIKDKFNSEIIPTLVRLNYGDTVEVYPSLIHSGISDIVGEELMKIITGYTKDGVINRDEQLEDFVRKAHRLPKKMKGELLDNQQKENDVNPNDAIEPKADNSIDNMPDNDESNEVNLNEKSNKSTKVLIDEQAEKITKAIQEESTLASDKYINDVMNKYKQLPNNKKQTATNSVVMGRQAILKKEIKRILTETAFKSLDAAKKEAPTTKEIKLSSKSQDFARLNIEEIKLANKSQLPAHISVLIEKQAGLISEQVRDELVSKLSFSYSSIETKVQDEFVIRQSMQDDAKDYIDAAKLQIKGVNAAALIVNETRMTYFFDDNVVNEIHSFTFVNANPKSPICKELAGTTFATNDAESLRYTPPLHHNCKSYLRANLKVSKGTDRLEISTLSPSADAKKSITL